MNKVGRTHNDFIAGHFKFGIVFSGKQFSNIQLISVSQVNLTARGEVRSVGEVKSR